MDEEFEKMLKYLGLRGLLANWDHYTDIAKKGSFSSVRLLKYVVEQEYKTKQENARKRRISLAKIPEPFVIETFPFDRQPKLNKKTILTHYDCL
ncbi:MAG: ATP-binding protein, partial [Desulfobacula sp.]|uniref:ATP-binding protein n=1 Tax=Desulfobacula sp. TaxID=2593537 RepID=UPI0025C44841